MESSSNVSEISKNRRQQLNLQVFAILIVASIIASVAGIPYVSELLKLPVPSFKELLVGILLQTLINVPIILLGLHLGGKIGLGARDLRVLIARKPKAWQHFCKTAGYAFIVGLITGTVLLSLSKILYSILPSEVVNITKTIKVPSASSAFLGSISAGINEEIMLRLFIMSLLAWLFTKILRRPQVNHTIIWTANIIAALLFGASHLPLATEIYKGLTPAIVFYIVFLNSLGGTLFGWLYWKRGILAAMIAHFSGNIVLHVIPALFIK